MPNLKRTILLVTLLTAAFIMVGCSDKEDDKVSLTESGMKCGAGKCGTSMVDGNSVVAKKKKNILSQMRRDDPRKDCVIKANSNKALYDCVRDPKSKRLTTKCGNANDDITMKCGAGKCSSGMSKPKVPPKPESVKPEPVMKCAAGKCSGGK
ncbi:MAG: hypothetical protein U9Q90_09360 [Campylobacterota bacterium]|nr:hypothetical protein [Campylobacterota bacterium]